MRKMNESEKLTIAASQSFKEKEYWLKKLSGELVKSSFPYDYKKTGANEPKMDIVTFRFRGELFTRLMKLSNESDLRLHMIFVAVLTTLLNKYTGNMDIIMGMPIEKQEIEGDFVNTVLVLRNILEDQMTFKQLLLQVRKTIVEVIENQNYPCETLVYDLGLNIDSNEFPLFDVAILLENLHDKKYLRHISTNMIFSFLRTGDCIEGTLEYNTLLYEAKTLEKIVKHLEKLLEEVLTDINLQLDDVEILSREEINQILFDFNNRTSETGEGISYPREKTINQLVEEQVEKNPDNLAVMLEDNRLTYKELNQKAIRLAYTLREKGVQAETIVGLIVERSIEMIVGILGILKAGGGYLPIDPEYPKARIIYMVEDSGANLMLSTRNIVNKYEYKGEFIDLESADCYREECSNPEIVNNSSNIAYVIYTSGSTGEPKGVVVEHRSIVNTLYWRKHYYQFDSTDVVLQVPSFSFDSSVEDIFTPLISDSRLILIREQNRFDMKLVGKHIEGKRVTHVLVTPSLYHTFLTEIPESLINLRTITIAGDHFTGELVKEHFDKLGHVKLYNEYGPTENSVCTTVYEFKPDKTRVLIGKPISNVSCYILDKNMKLVPIGVPGQLCISGSGLARGYLKQPTLNKEKFVENPYAAGKQMYKTGDLARWLTDGNLEFLGRIDHQVKVQGVRVELGEIESQLLRHEDIKEVVVVAKVDKKGDKYLCAYLVMANDEMELDVSKMIEHLLINIPEYIIPAYFFKLEKMPLTPNGKIDRTKLPEPDTFIDIKAEYIPPRDQKEKILTEIWKQELEQDQIGIKENYFNIGGDSIKSIKLVTLINKELKINLRIVDLYVNNTIEKLAAFIDKEKIAVPEEKEEDTAVLQELEDLKSRIMKRK